VALFVEDEPGAFATLVAGGFQPVRIRIYILSPSIFSEKSRFFNL
jgi:hypothetical protein